MSVPVLSLGGFVCNYTDEFKHEDSPALGKRAYVVWLGTHDSKLDGKRKNIPSKYTD